MADSPVPAPYDERTILLLGYDMRKPHNYLAVIADGWGSEPHLLDRYNGNASTLCGLPVPPAFDIEPNGCAFCLQCYDALVARVNAQMGWHLPTLSQA